MSPTREERARRDEEKLAAMIAEHYPKRLLRPWRKMVREGGLTKWNAHMLPLQFGPDDEARYTLRRQRPFVELHDTDRAALIARAQRIEGVL